MEFYIIADKNSNNNYLSFNHSGHYYQMKECNILKAEKFPDIEYAREVLLDYLEPRNCDKDINDFEILKIKYELEHNSIEPIDYSEQFKFSYTTSKYEISKEDVIEMLDFKYGIKDKDFDFTYSIKNPRSRTHEVFVKVNFK